MFCLIRKQSVCLRRSSAMPVQCIAYNKIRRLLKMVTRLSRSIAAIGLAVIMICMFAFPTVASVAAAQPKRIINVQVIYDESFRAFASERTGWKSAPKIKSSFEVCRIPLRAHLERWSTIQFSNLWINARQSLHGSTCLARFMLRALVLADRSPNRGTLSQLEPYSRGCTCFPDDECFISSNTPGHHNSASRLIY